METFFTNYDLEIIGENEKLYRCSCCGYFTLDNVGEYDICRLCNWEDEGIRSDEINKFSHVNKSTLKDYKYNFEQRMKNEEVIYDK